MFPGTVPDGGRATKKQIVCYVSPEYNDILYNFCLENNLTRQELLGRAINKSLALIDIEKRLDVSTRRIVRMPGRKRSVREGKEHFSREGKTALAGWFPKSGVDAISSEIAKKDTNFQRLAMVGLNIIVPIEETGLLSPVKKE